MRDRGYLDARSSTRLAHADRLSLALSAARWYLASLSSLTRKVIQRRSPFAKAGRPLGFLGSIGGLCTNK